jgi:hypothetical protein
MSTYSPDLRIELITTGDQAGTWGTTTNANLAYVVEQAIAGYVSVSVTTANQAFTHINGGSSTAALNQAVHAAIALTTTTTANFAVYAPPASKQYTIYNASSYAATIYNSTVLGNTTAAGTGVVIPAGKTMTVWSDGTNFAFQNTHFEGTSTTQSFGTNTTALSTTAFVQAALQALHPVGSVYINATNNTNPATLFGFGTWVSFGAGRVPVGFDAGNPLFDAAEETGGSYDATLVSHAHTGTTGSENQNHTHSGSTSGVGDHQHESGTGVQDIGAAFGRGGNATSYRIDLVLNAQNTPYTSSAGAHSHSFSTGGVSANHQHNFTTSTNGASATNANIQPYITVYMWKRVS